MLKNLYWKIRDIISQLIILLVIGAALIWIGKNLAKFELLLDAKWINLLFYFCLLIYLILFQSIIRSLISSNIIHSYNPTDSESLKRLQNKKKYHLNNSLHNYQSDSKGFFLKITSYLEELNYLPVTKNNAGFIFEKKTPFLNKRLLQKQHRIFVIYRPLLNVLIVDNILNEAVEFIQYYLAVKPVSQNKIIIITDMENEEEILSAGTGIVNYLSAKRSGYLYPIFIDLNYNHIFYPQDVSLIPWYKRIARKIDIIRFKSFLNQIGLPK